MNFSFILFIIIHNNVMVLLIKLNPLMWLPTTAYLKVFKSLYNGRLEKDDHFNQIVIFLQLLL